LVTRVEKENAQERDLYQNGSNRLGKRTHGRKEGYVWEETEEELWENTSRRRGMVDNADQQ
jgi:hypothetical protein